MLRTSPRQVSGGLPRRSHATAWRRLGDHSSGTAVTGGLKQPTREPWTGHPQTLPYLALHRMGFTKLPVSPPSLVSSYLTVSPLPAFALRQAQGFGGRSVLCGTFPGVAPGRRYRPSCPSVLGLSSRPAKGGTSGHPDHFAETILAHNGKMAKGGGREVPGTWYPVPSTQRKAYRSVGVSAYR